jgi:hypothetical protein
MAHKKNAPEARGPRRHLYTPERRGPGVRLLPLLPLSVQERGPGGISARIRLLAAVFSW